MSDFEFGDPDEALDAMLAKEFGDINVDDKYPGSRHKRRSLSVGHAEVIAPDDSGWSDKPLQMKINGVMYEFFTIGQLAMALNRKPITIRKWEDRKVIPKARYRDPRGRRLYTRRQVEGLIDLCHQHGILVFQGRPAAGTVTKAFTKDVIALWKEPLGSEGP